jgi:sterol desaturase/sphingolipid hydroxylase (fatty acid hydroxylase superfamily)
MLQMILIFAFGAIFLVLERVRPGRQLPNAPGWYARAIFLNACQLGIVIVAGVSWNRWFREWSLLDMGSAVPAILQGFIGWFVGTFVFYWWHRIRHDSDIVWRMCHQIHHSPSRIEILTAFYKHPGEIAINSMIASALMFTLLGASVEGAAWFNLFAAVGEYFYHSNLRTPHWLGFLIQRPEHHSIHHALNVHRFNYGDITLWDRLFGTFKDTDRFAPRCGFPEGKERNLFRMMAFRDNY